MAGSERRGTVLFWIKAVCLLILVLAPLHPEVSAQRLLKVTEDIRGLPGAIIFCVLWLGSLVAIVATAYLPPLWLRALLAVVLIPSTVVSVVHWAITQDHLLYWIAQIWWEERAWIGRAMRAYADYLPIGIVMLAVASAAILLPPNLQHAPAWLRRWPSRIPVLGRMERARSRVNHLAAIGIVPVLIALNVVQAGEGLMGLPPQYHASVLFTTLMYNQQFVAKRRAEAKVEVKLEPDQTSRPHIVLVINESMRGDFLDINHDRGVTPKLMSVRDRISNFGYASSMANCSSSTHQAMRVGMHPDEPERSLDHNPFIWSYAKRAGYRSVYIDAQVEKGTHNNSLGGYELGLIDETHYLDRTGLCISAPCPDKLDEENWSRDVRIQKKLDKVLAEATPDQPLFIYMIQFGAHFPYRESYPAKSARFDTESEALTEKQRRVNDYKNSAAWSVDNFFEAMLFNERRYPNTVVLYTSDHGENLDIGTHCTLHGVQPYEGLVPLMAITDHPVWRPRFDEAAQMNMDRGSHFNIVPTVLEIMGFEREGIEAFHGRGLLVPLDQPRRFLSRGASITRANVGQSQRLVWNALPDDMRSQGAP